MLRLRDIKFWSKGAAIVLWSLYLTIYMYLFKQIEPDAPDNLRTFIGLGISVLIGGSWWNFITNLYNTPLERYNHRYLISALVVLGVLFSALWVISLYAWSNVNVSSAYTGFTAAYILIHIPAIFVLPAWVLESRS
ncbi:hypothetical protein HYO03_08910 [Vibrio parahaemolyticus]|uniref:hypothetical protein n=1 Tax=Vibrio parahaemolyticus TaxID=670 RepID=UPI0005F16836|nr:hypothetical protein [Vibrio parahaemolyticus]MBM5066166.1 hypothetical protein [Vibrio parahaemolyticus]MDG2647191.1 hypothetical protein [Vibrio parahaemolyticus]MDG3391359.1 hypothetical protein [Vibrio parahaemolyticus]MDG3401645.1 hypothetical protein [Vibrio parahaemolyticus]